MIYELSLQSKTMETIPKYSFIDGSKPDKVQNITAENHMGLLTKTFIGVTTVSFKFHTPSLA